MVQPFIVFVSAPLGSKSVPLQFLSCVNDEVCDFVWLGYHRNMTGFKFDCGLVPVKQAIKMDRPYRPNL